VRENKEQTLARHPAQGNREEDLSKTSRVQEKEGKEVLPQGIKGSKFSGKKRKRPAALTGPVFELRATKR